MAKAMGPFIAIVVCWTLIAIVVCWTVHCYSGCVGPFIAIVGVLGFLRLGVWLSNITLTGRASARSVF